MQIYTQIHLYLLSPACCYRSVAKSYPTLCEPHGLQHARLPWPSSSPSVCSNSCPLSHWCHPTISSSNAPFSSCPQSFLAPAWWAAFLGSIFTLDCSQYQKCTQGKTVQMYLSSVSLLFQSQRGNILRVLIKATQFMLVCAGHWLKCCRDIHCYNKPDFLFFLQIRIKCISQTLSLLLTYAHYRKLMWYALALNWCLELASTMLQARGGSWATRQEGPGCVHENQDLKD